MTPPTHSSSVHTPLRFLPYILILLATYLGSYRADVDGNLDLYHEGERLAHIDAVRDGALPFRDIHIPHGLGEDVLKPLLACRLWGDSVASLRTLGQNSYIYRGYLPPLGPIAAIIACIVLTRRPGLAALMALMLLLSLCEITERHCFGFLAIAAAGAHMKRERAAWLILTGGLAGCALIYSLDVGIYVLATILGWLCIDAWIRPRITRSKWSQALRSIGLLSIGLAVPVLPMFIWCTMQGILDDLLSNLRIQLLLRGQLYPAAYPTPSWLQGAPLLDNLRVTGAVISFFYLMPSLYLVGLLFAVFSRKRARPSTRSTFALVSLLGLCFMASVVGRPDLWHLAYTVPAFGLFAVVTLVAVRPRAPARRPHALLLAIPHLLITISLVDFGSGGVLGQKMLGTESRLLPAHLRSQGQPLIETRIPRLAGLRIGQKQATYLEALVGYLRAHTTPADTLLDLSDQGLVFFLANRRSATKYHYISYCSTSGLLDRLVHDLHGREELPLYVIRYEQDTLPPGRLGTLLRDAYSPEVTIGYTQLWRRVSADGHP